MRSTRNTLGIPWNQIFIESTNVIIQTTLRGRSLVSIAVYYEKEKVIAYNPRQLEVPEKNYPTPDLEIGEIVFSFKIWERYLDSIPPWKSKRSSRTEQAKPLRVRALVMTINSNLPPQIHKTQVESLKTENVKDENLHGIDNEFENRLDGTLYIRRRSRLPRKYLLEIGKLWSWILSQDYQRKQAVRHYLGNCGHQKSFADVRRKPLEFHVEVGTVAYRLELPKKLSRVHSTFYVSNSKKCLTDEPLAIPLDEIQVNDKLHFIEEPVEIMKREVKRLKQSRIPIIKVRWNSRRGPEFTREREDQMQKKYTRTFFTNSAPVAEDEP
ncbi:hypothetical protein Tco_0572277 [Tanacetum coccineum]